MTSSAHSPFPDSPILEAELVRTEWGDYKATLILPDGQHETLSGDQLDAVRQRVIGVARGYLRTQVGHAGRLRVQDPDGTWLLGVPLENSDLIPLTASTISPPAAAAAAAATATTAAASGPPSRVLPTRREPPVLPARPSVTPRRPAPPRARRGPRSIGGRLAAGGALLLALVALVALAEAVQGSSPRRASHHAAATRPSASTGSVRTPAVTRSVTTSVTTPVAHRAPHPRRPRPRHGHVTRRYATTLRRRHTT